MSAPDSLEKAILKQLGSDGRLLNDWRIVRRSIDARKQPVRINAGVLCALGNDKAVAPEFQPIIFNRLPANARKVVIVGAGPAGYFAALKAIEKGWKPIVLERGKDVDARRLDITTLNREGLVDGNSNYCFGEGGAGTFSDGKLFTRSKKRGNVDEILNLLVQHGASETILIDSHPHIGSDRLPIIMKNIRKTIIDNGGEVHFGCKVDNLILQDNGAKAIECAGVHTSDGKTFYGPVILATGHSARDVYRFLDSEGVKLEAKGLAIGVRLEHPQKLIDSIQYHSKTGRGAYLPAAEYNFVSRQDERGVYSFCMCPGGVIVPAASQPGQGVVNGMSSSARASIWANSGMVVELHPGDIPGYSDYGVFEMLMLQEDLEKKFYEAAGNCLKAPAQRMRDFTEGKMSKNLPPSSYIPGLIEARIDQLLPDFISERLKRGFLDFGRKAKGFLTNEAVLIGLESRTSSPIRIPRNKETMEHIEISGLYPAGEGAGYAGGIVSAAIDGQNAFSAIAGSPHNKK